jgi:hypothetical protein
LSISEDQGQAAPGNPGIGDSAGDSGDGTVPDGTVPDGTDVLGDGDVLDEDVLDDEVLDGEEPGGWFDGDLDDALEDALETKEAPTAAKWGMAGLLLVYAGLGSYCVASALGDMAWGTTAANPGGITRSVAAAMTQTAGSSGTAAAGAQSSDSVVARSYAARAARRALAASAAASADSQAPAQVEVLTAVSATAVGPDGASDGDHPQLAPYVIDPHSATAWITHWYASAHFGDLKDGTGLLLDMGKPVTIKQIELALAGSPGFWGANLEIRIGDTPNLANVTPVAMAEGVGGWVSAELPHAVQGRYIQIWFTKLPLDSWGTYQEHVYGVTVRGSTATPPASSHAATTTHTTSHTSRAGGHGGFGGGHAGHGRGGYAGHGGGRGHGGGYGGGHGGGGDGGYGGYGGGPGDGGGYGD